MPKFLFWALLLKTALVYFRQEQFLISDKEKTLSVNQKVFLQRAIAEILICFNTL
ncbi:MAG: hypothetical protein V7K42_02385 [Nostoc sp.]